MMTVNEPQQLKDKVELRYDCPMVRAVDKETLEAFTTFSGDGSKIHRADAESPVIPGNLLISLLPAMLQSGLQVQTFDYCKTVSLDKVRFYHSVGLNDPLQLSFQLLKVRSRGNSTFVVSEMTLRRTKNAQIILTATQTDCYVT